MMVKKKQAVRLVVGIEPGDAQQVNQAFKIVHKRQPDSWREAFRWLTQIAVRAAKVARRKGE